MRNCGCAYWQNSSEGSTVVHYGRLISLDNDLLRLAGSFYGTVALVPYLDVGIMQV